MNSIDDILNSGGGKGKSMKFPTIGTSYSGVVVSAEPRQASDPETGQKKTWDDGNPMMQAVIGIQTDERDPSIEGDDGVRFDYVKMWGKQRQAFQAAAQAAGGSPKPGDFYSVTFVGEGEKAKPHHSAPKLFRYEIRKANPLDAVVNAGPTQQANPVAQQPVQQAYAQPVQQQPVQQAYAQPVQQAAPVAQQPVQQPVAQAAPAIDPQFEERVRTLIGKALEDDAIAAVIDGATPEAINQVRLRMAAAGGQGF